MGAKAYQITSLTTVFSTVYSDADQRKHQSSASLAFVWGIHRGYAENVSIWWRHHDIVASECKSGDITWNWHVRADSSKEFISETFIDTFNEHEQAQLQKFHTVDNALLDILAANNQICSGLNKTYKAYLRTTVV